MRYTVIKGELNGGATFELEAGVLRIELPGVEMLAANSILRELEQAIEGLQDKAAAVTPKAVVAAPAVKAAAPVVQEKPAAKVVPLKAEQKAPAAKPKAEEKEAEPLPKKSAEPAAAPPDDDIPFGKEEPAADEPQPLKGDGNADWGMDEVPDELLKATKLKDIVQYLQDRGYKTTPQLVAVCERYRDKLPVLQRLTGDINERIERVLMTMG